MQKIELLPLAYNTMIHIIFLFVTLTGTYLFIICDKQKEIVKQESEDLLNSILESFPPTKKKQMADMLQTALSFNSKGIVIKDFPLPFQTYENQLKVADPVMTVNNEWFNQGIILTSVILVAFGIFVSLIFIHKDIPIKDILIENLILSSCVGTCALIFFYGVIVKYRPLNSSETYGILQQELSKLVM